MVFENTLQFAQQLDTNDELNKYKNEFHFPQHNGLHDMDDAPPQWDVDSQGSQISSDGEVPSELASDDEAGA